MYFEDTPSEVSKGDGKHAIGKYRRWGWGVLVLAVGSLTTLWPVGIWKVENMPYELGDLATETSKQRAEGAAWFLFAAIIKWEREN